jgi:hypothetical protein
MPGANSQWNAAPYDDSPNHLEAGAERARRDKEPSATEHHN